MQMIKNFGETLKELKDICDIKSITLANYLGYDISYISKWCANKKLPSGRNIIHILDEISRIFSREIMRNGQLVKFNEKYKQNIKNIEELSDCIKTMLEDSYDRSKRNENNLKKDENKVIFGKNDIIAFICDKISEISGDEKKILDIYITLDILKINVDYKDIKVDLSNLSKINIKAGCDMSRINEGSFEKLRNLSSNLNLFKKCNIQIYDNIAFSKSNIFLVKNEFAVLFSLDGKGEIDFGVILTNNEILDKIYSYLKSRFDFSEILIDILDEEKLKHNEYIFNFYNSDNFEFLFNNNFDYLQSNQMMQSFNVKNNDIKLIDRELANLQEIIEKKFCDSNVKIFILKEALDDYIYLNLVRFGADGVKDIFYRIDLLIKYMSLNKNIKVYMIDSRKFNDDSMKYKMNIYGTENFVIFRRYTNEENLKDSFYIVKNLKMLKCIRKAYLELEEKEYVKKVTPQEFEEFLSRYKKLV